MDQRSCNIGDHQALVLWASACAEHVLPFFEEHYPEDDRSRIAIEAGRAWERGEIRCGIARSFAFAAHAAARNADFEAAIAAARAAGHAAATTHVVKHAHAAAKYAVKAVSLASTSNGVLVTRGVSSAWVAALP